MNNRISKDAYERYLDATVALFMECYTAMLSFDLREEFFASEVDTEFPDELDKRCRTMIKKEYKLQRRRSVGKNIMKGLRYVASFVVVLFALASFLFVSVEAIRVPIINYYVEQGDGYWEFSSRSKTTGIELGKMNPEDPLKGLISAEYKLQTMDDRLPAGLTVVYLDSKNNEVFFEIETGKSLTKLDTENAQVAEECIIRGNKGVVLIKNDRTTIAWGNETGSNTFILTANALNQQELLYIAERIMGNFE